MLANLQHSFLSRQAGAVVPVARMRLAIPGLPIAERYQLAPGVLCPNGTLEAIARVHPATLEQLSAIREVRQWQLREFGDALLQALKQPSAVQ